MLHAMFTSVECIHSTAGSWNVYILWKERRMCTFYETIACNVYILRWICRMCTLNGQNRRMLTGNGIGVECLPGSWEYELWIAFHCVHPSSSYMCLTFYWFAVDRNRQRWIYSKNLLIISNTTNAIPDCSKFHSFFKLIVGLFFR